MVNEPKASSSHSQELGSVDDNQLEGVTAPKTRLQLALKRRFSPMMQHRRRLESQRWQEFDRDDELAQIAIEEVYGIPKAVTKNLIDLRFNRPEEATLKPLSELLAAQSFAASKRILSALSAGLEEYVLWSEKVRVHPIYSLLTTGEVKGEEILASLRRNGAKDLFVDQPMDVPLPPPDEKSLKRHEITMDAFRAFTEIVSESQAQGDALSTRNFHLSSVFFESGEEGLGSINSILSTLEEVQGLTTIDDKNMLKELREVIDFALNYKGGISSRVQEFVAASIQWEVGGEVLKNVSQEARSQLVTHLSRGVLGGSFGQLVGQRLGTVRGYLEKLSELNMIEVGIAAAHGTDSPARTLGIVTEIAEVLSSGIEEVGLPKNKTVKDVEKILAVLPSSRRIEFLEAVATAPRALEIAAFLRPVGAGEVEVADFVLERGGIQIGGDGSVQALNALLKIAEKKSQRAEGLLFFRRAEEISVSPNATELLEALQQKLEVAPLVSAHLDAICMGELAKAELLLKVCKTQTPPSGSIRKEFLSDLDRFSDEAIAGILPKLEKGDFATIRREMRTLQGTRNSSPLPTPQVKKVRLSDEAQFEQALTQSKVRNGVHEKATSTYQALPERVRPRLVNLIRTQPKSLERFCDLVQSYGTDTEWMIILQSEPLFQLLKKDLKTDGDAFESLLRSLSSVDERNRYSSMLLGMMESQGKDSHSALLDETTLKFVEAKDLTTRGISRVIFVESNISPERREALRRLVDHQIEVACIDMEKRRTLPQVNEADAVFFDTREASHATYYRFKDQAARGNAYFFHVSGKTQEALKQLLAKLD